MAVIILTNEILFKRDHDTLYLTINLEDESFGVFSNMEGHIVEPSFKHVFANTGNAPATAAIDADEYYVWLHRSGAVELMNERDKSEWENCILKGSRCNCLNIPTTIVCSICHGHEVIFTKYGNTFLDQFFQ